MSTDRQPGGVSAVKLALAARKFRNEVADPQMLLHEPIAIVGMACRFPGGAHDPGAYWQLLMDKGDAIVEVPPERWDIDAYYDPDPDVPGRMNTRWGGFLRQPVDQFDPQFFGIAPREAASMDPQQRLLLEVAWEAIEDAGLTQERLAGTAAGVFFAIYGPDYGQQLHREHEAIDGYATLGTVPCMASGRLSFLLDLRGPSVVVDTACSSSLVAIHLACQSLRTGESSTAIAGGVSLTLTPERNISLTKWRFMSPDGRCKAFDARADGWVRGDGAGVVVLKRLADAIADGDRVLAVVRGTAINQDGRSNVLTAPNGAAQQAVVRAALASGRVQPHEITFVEAHGTGTSIGDPIELDALAETIGRPADGPSCYVGAVKNNIGHLEAAAGVAGVIKTVLALQHEVIPGNAHFETLNPLVSLDGSRLKVSAEHAPWPSGAVRRLAGVSAFGFSGTNAHVVIEEAPQVPARSDDVSGTHVYALPVSGRSLEAMTAMAAAVAARLRSLGRSRLLDICHTAATRRSHHDHRAVAIGTTPEALADAFEAFVRGEVRSDVVTGRRLPGRRADAVWVFSGQGPQWWAMGRELFASEPAYRTAVEDVDRRLRAHLSWSLIEQLHAPEDASRLGETEVAQPAIFALQLGLAALLTSWGQKPAAVVGHSVGEIAAACVAGVLELDAAVRVVAHRARLMQQATGLGRMAAIGLPVAEARAMLGDAMDGASIAAVNAPRSITISGDRASVEAIVAALEARQVFARLMPVDYAFHSAQMEPFARQLALELEGLRTATPSIPLVSTVTGAFAVDGDYGATYWSRNVRDAVRFWPAIERLVEAGHTTFLEIAPHPVLASSLRQGLDGRVESPTIAAMLHRERPELVSVRTAMAALHAAGGAIDWAKQLPAGGRVVSLPPYAWQRQRYWAEVANLRSGGPRRQVGAAGGADARLRRLRSPAVTDAVFEARVSAAAPAFVGDHVVHDTVLWPAAAFIATAAEGLRQLADPERDVIVFEDVSIHEPLALDGAHTRTLQLIVEGGDPSRRFRIVSLDVDDEGWTTHVTGTAAPAPAAAHEPAAFDAEEVESRCSERIDADAWYRAMRAAGFDFGPTFRTIHAVRRCDGEAIGDVRMPAGLEQTTALHPVLIDGCLQTIWAAVPDTVRRDMAGDAYVPVGCGRLRLHHGGAGRLRSHVTLSSVGDGIETFRAGLRAYDAAGRLVLSADDVVLKRATRGSLIRATKRSIADWLYQVTWIERPRDRPASPVDAAGTWVIVAGRDDLARDLADALERSGAAVTVAGSGEGLGEVVRTAGEGGRIAGIVDCRPLDATGAASSDAILAAEERMLGGALDLVHAAVGLESPAARGLVMLTRGAVPLGGGVDRDGLLQAPLHGFLRTVALEHPELDPRYLDLDPARSAGDVQQIVDELRAGPDGEIGVALREAGRYVARLTRAAHATSRQAGPVRLEIGRRGTLDRLELRSTSRPVPAPGEVVVAVEAAGLNFRDVLNTLGMYPGDAGPLGSECVGVIAAVGAGVEAFAVGDPVIALAQGCFGTFATVRAEHVVARPSNLAIEDAATLPVAFMTARYGLEHLAKMGSGDRVLIHAAAGGVGLAAVQLALRAGAEVFATAGSAEKHAFLHALGVTHVMGSRSLDFADQVRERTGGRGVDIVLNSLAGEFIDRSVDVLAPGGRFIEIGKTGIWDAAAMARVRPDVDYHVLYLGEVVDRDPALGQALLASVVDDVASGGLRPLVHRSFRIGNAAAADLLYLHATHIVLSVISVTASQSVVGPSARATYLITGGLGALGLAVAEGLATSGARHLVLAGRTAPSAPAAARIEALRAGGAEVVVFAADVANADDVSRMVASIDPARPLRGVVHAAGVIDDGVVMQQTRERFAGVLGPKVAGTWHLHEATRGLPLDFFVLFSSVAAVLGSPGQSGYGAANAFMDGFAAFRRAEGLVATAINWGAWADGGMASALSDADARRWASIGVEAIHPAQGVQALAEVLASGLPQVTVMPISWRRYAASLGEREAPRLLSDLVDADRVRPSGAAADARAPRTDLAARLAAAPEARRPAVLLAFVTEQALAALGLPSSHAIDPHQGLRDIGLDSLMAIELRNRLQDAVGDALPATLAFDFPTPNALAGYLAGRLIAPGAVVATVDPAVPDGTTQVAALSDDEAEILLRQELDAMTDRAGRRKGAGR